MKFKALYTLPAKLLLGASMLISTANAALITETWNYEVTNVTGNYLTKNIGDTISLIFVFDNESLKMTRTDGINDLVLCAGAANADCSSTNPSNPFHADFVSIDGLDELFDWDAMRADGNATYDRYGYDYANRFENNGNQVVDIRDSTTKFYAIADTLLDFDFFYRTAGMLNQRSVYNANFISRTDQPVNAVVAVPEPSTLAILGIGILGFAARRFTK